MNDRNNIFRVRLPYDLLIPGLSAHAHSAGRKVIFWGTCFRQLPADVDDGGFVRITNQCLEYVRKKCKGYALYYKPHPAEKDEYKLLNLDSFEIMREPTVAEVFLWKHSHEIAHSFSVMSNAAISAHDFGVSSHVFYKLFKSVLGAGSYASCEWFFQNMPESFFIQDLGQELNDIRPVFERDVLLEREMANLLNGGSGKIWFILVEPGLTTAVAAIAALIKKLEPRRPIGLIISRQRRWGMVNLADFKDYFDTINVFPRVFYTLRPARLWEAVKTAFAIRRFPIGREDIMIGFAHNALVENCFLSYFPRNRKISFFSDIYFDMMYRGNYPDFFPRSGFKTALAGRFWNRIFEPLLGLHRTLYLQYGDGRVLNIIKYQKPLDEIYEKVYVARLQRG